MIKKTCLLILITIISLNLPALIQAQDQDLTRSWLKMGAALGFFRISHDDFTGVYRHRWGDCYGGFVAIRSIREFHALGKYKYFRMDGKNGKNLATGIPYNRASWQEAWYNIGVRRYTDSTHKTNSFFGFGISLFNIKENPEIALFSNAQKPDSRKHGSGFFLELGLQRRLNRFFSGQIEFEITSAGAEGTSILESQSIGGFFLGLGLALEPF